MHLPILSTHLSVAVLGVVGSYHHQVALALFPNARLRYCASFHEVAGAVCRGDAQKGIVAIANSTIGTLPTPREVLRHHAAQLVIETYYTLPITHCLVVAEPTMTERTIRKVLSHPAALQQCHTYIQTKQWQALPATDTATAVKEVMAQRNGHLAAIASPFAAQHYGAYVLPPSIQNQIGNATTFAVIRGNG